MVKRNYWINSINELWKRRNIIYLQGVRRVGKTFLSKSIDGIKYFDCELPSVRNVIEDPESFLKSFRGQKIVIDEIHRLKNPSELLKIAADYYPDTKIIVTGSSIITGTKKFKDTLTGRKKDIFLTPMNYSDLRDFKIEDIKKRLFYGGLPEFFLKEFDDKEYVEWLEFYFAKDIQDLFGVGKRSAFLKFCELVIIRSGGIFEATSYASPCEVSRETIFSYLDILNSTMMVNILRPFSKRRANEIISAPKVYSFDTGFIKAFKYGVGKGALVSKWLFKKKKLKVSYELIEMLTVPFIQSFRGIVIFRFGLVASNFAALTGRIFGMIKYLITSE